MKRAGDQIDHKEEENGAKPPGMIHVEETEKVQHLIETIPITLNIFHARCILSDQGAEYGEEGKEDEKKNGEFE